MFDPNRDFALTRTCPYNDVGIGHEDCCRNTGEYNPVCEAHSERIAVVEVENKYGGTSFWCRQCAEEDNCEPATAGEALSEEEPMGPDHMHMWANGPVTIDVVVCDACGQRTTLGGYLICTAGECSRIECPDCHYKELRPMVQALSAPVAQKKAVSR